MNENEPIQGKMVVVDKVVDRSLPQVGMSSAHLEDTIKRELIDKIVTKLVEEKLIEFTRTEDYASDLIRFRARIFATPDNEVRYLRKNGHN
jgi:hypothetical protein